MLDLTVVAVVVGQHIRIGGWHPSRVGQGRQTIDRATTAQRRITPPRDQLTGLCEKLNLADTTTAELHIMPLESDLTPKPFMFADAQAHVVGILNGDKIQMLTPHERCQCF